MAARDSFDEQLLDVLAARVVPQLHVQDVQALGQTCSQMRRLVRDSIPGSSWQHCAELSFPPGHPVLAIPTQTIPQELSRLAALHCALKQGEVAATLELSLWQGCSEDPCASALSQAGDLLIARWGEQLVLSSLAQSGDRILRRQLWAVPAPPAPHTWWHTACHFEFAANNEAVAVSQTLYDDSDQPSQNINEEPQEDVWDQLFVLDLQSRALRPVAATPEFHNWDTLLLMQEAQFSPDSRFLLVPWAAYVENTAPARVEVYACETLARVCRVEFPQFRVVVYRCTFSPDSAHFATVWPGQFHVHSVRGRLSSHVLKNGHSMYYGRFAI